MVELSEEGPECVASCGVALPQDSTGDVADTLPSSTLQQASTGDLKSLLGMSMEGGQIRAGIMETMGSAENMGLVFMAICAVNTALTAVFVKLAAATGLSTWQIIFVRSCIMAVACAAHLLRTGDMPWGSR